MGRSEKSYKDTVKYMYEEIVKELIEYYIKAEVFFSNTGRQRGEVAVPSPISASL